jgi:Nif-specific regulatory protein
MAAAEVLWRGTAADDVGQFLREALPAISQATGGDYLAVMAPIGGRWELLAETPARKAPKMELLSEALDRGIALRNGDWYAAPLDPRGATGELLALHRTEGRNAATTLEGLGALALFCGQALAAVRTRLRERRHVERLEALLEIVSEWNQTQEMEPLLVHMAEAAQRLLQADRASIFLWDRPNRTLVGRPALGVESGELRIPDDSGIVGDVVQHGRPRRVDLTSGQEEINRQVDQALGYQTRTLLCVPLRGRGGELFGAFEVINKLQGIFNDEDETALTELATHAAIALENTQDREKLLSSRRLMTDQAAQGVRLIGASPAIEALRSTIRRVAATELAVLVLGENGTGKEVVSQSIHYLSNRRDQPFIAVNCAAISESLLESELFGHEKGAFTDAHQARPGKFELASGGTLFLDEIGDLSLAGQSKLLRVLEEKIVVRVGGSMPIYTDARVIAATNQNLAEMVRQKRFREDLFFRLNVVTLDLPPLRDRREDVLLLAEHFLQDFSRKARRKPPRLTADARRRLESHTWPGNVRELRNLMERLAYLSAEDQIRAEDLSFITAPRDDTSTMLSSDLPLSEATDRFQTEFIRKGIERARGNMSEAAQRLGLHRSNLYRKMRQLGMDAADGGKD